MLSTSKKFNAMVKGFMAAASLGIMAVSFSGAANADVNSLDYNKVYKIGIENGYYPYEYYDDKGVFTGYDVDVIGYVCNKLGIKCELEKGQFDALIPNLLYKKTDLVISDLSITAERRAKVNFSISYVPPQPAVYIVNQNSKFTSPKQFKVIGVELGTTLSKYLYAMNTNKQYKVITYPSFDAAMLDLKSGRVDGVFESQDTSAKYVEDPKEGVKTIGSYVFSPILTEGTGIAFRKSDNFLRTQVDNVLKQMEADGTLTKFRNKYGIKVTKEGLAFSEKFEKTNDKK